MAHEFFDALPVHLFQVNQREYIFFVVVKRYRKKIVFRLKIIEIITNRVRVKTMGISRGCAEYLEKKWRGVGVTEK